MPLTEFNWLTSELERRIRRPLPGADAHEALAPPHRRELIRMNPDRLNARLSGVLLLLSPDTEGEALITLIKRTEDKSVHSGQIAFPGGRFEPDDKSLTCTALREAEEEIGIDPTSVTLIGNMSELFVPPSNFIIQPLLAKTGFISGFSPSPAEVASVFSVPVAYFFKSGVQGMYEIDYRAGIKLQVPGYKYENHLIWGATAMILNELLEMIRGNGKVNDAF